MLEKFRTFIHGPSLPQRPQGRMNLEQRVSFDRSIQAAKARRTKFFHIRRKILIGTGAALGLTASAVVFGPQIIEPLLPYDEPQEYDGSIEQTRFLIDRWNKKVGENSDSFNEYAPKITRLASAYFSRQMQDIYPEKKNEHATSLEDKTTILSLEEYNQQNTCDEELPEPGYVDPNTQNIIFVPQALKIEELRHPSNVAKTFFLVALHEYLHLTARIRRDFQGMTMVQYSEKFIGKKMDEAQGLRFTYTDRVSPQGEKCGRSWWDQLEEMVVEDAATELAAKVNIENQESSYINLVRGYRLQIINKLGKDARWELLRFQQNSDLDGYLAYIGNRFRRPDIPPNISLPKDLQIALGSSIIGPIIDTPR